MPIQHWVDIMEAWHPGAKREPGSRRRLTYGTTGAGTPCRAFSTPLAVRKPSAPSPKVKPHLRISTSPPGVNLNPLFVRAITKFAQLDWDQPRSGEIM